ncbi:hypothetical protein Droror1_Dr00021948 [Drosera rotundifolia]
MVIPSKPHIILLSSPGYGHLIPVLNLATRLVTRHNVSVTVFAFSTTSVPSHHPALFDLVLLPHPTITFPPNTHIVSRLVIIVRDSLPSLRDSITAMKTPPTALVVDLFSTEAIKIGDELKILKFVFFATNAWYLAATVLNSYIKGKISPVETVEIPGCEPVRPGTLSDLMYDNDCPGNKEYKRIGREISTADGVLVNTWDDLERRTLSSFRSKEHMGKFINGPVWGVGPLVRGIDEAGSGSWAVEWLDRQPIESVLYISFGSGGTLTTWQTAEMAWAWRQVSRGLCGCYGHQVITTRQRPFILITRAIKRGTGSRATCPQGS